MVASLAGSRDLVQMLLDHGADPNTMDELERTALMFASLSRQDEVVALLEKKTSGGQTGPASLAVERPRRSKPINGAAGVHSRRTQHVAAAHVAQRAGRDAASWRWSAKIRMRAARRRSCIG
jgi:hypothetical protein